MKALAILTLLLAAPVLLAQDDDKVVKLTETFHVSAGARNKPLLMKVFAAVQKLEAEKHAGGSRTFTVKQVISPTSFVINAGGNSDYWLIPLERQEWSNRDRIKIDAEFTGDTKAFRDESGKDISFRVLKQVKSKPAPELTQEEFVQRLKDGETWTLMHFEERKCPDCKGEGMIRKPDEFIECEECYEGKLTIDYVVEW